MFKHFGILCLVAAWLLATIVVDAEVANLEFLNKQKLVYKLLWRCDQPEMDPELYDAGKDYSMEENLGSYEDEVHVTDFMGIYNKGMLPRGEIFSLFYTNHLEQAIALFKVFYYSKDFDTLYKTATWARIHVNEGLFVYAFSVAVAHCPLTRHIRIPAYHELNPHLYFDNQVFRKIHDARGYTDPTKVSIDNPIIVYGNSSKYYLQEEDQLNYYTADVEMNDIVYCGHVILPFWMAADEYGFTFKNRGTAYLWLYKLQYARHHLERLCNGMSEVKDFDWDQRVPYGYQPGLSYPNGQPLPHREENADFPNYSYKTLKRLRDLDFRLSAAIDMGSVVAKNGTFVPFLPKNALSVVGNLLEGNPDSVNVALYGSYTRLAKSTLGFSPEPLSKYKIFPSILQHYGVDQRDPIFWSLAKRIVAYHDQVVNKFPKYTHQQLAFTDVTIQSVEMDSITTFFAYKDYLASAAVKINSPDDEMVIKVRQERLEHKPFNYTITVDCKKESKATVRVFLGPKYNVNGEDIDITEAYKFFWPIDVWNVDLNPGINKIERNNTQNTISVPDEPSSEIFYRKIERAIEGEEIYEIPRSLYGLPERISIPRGKREGYPYQLFIFVSPYSGVEFHHSKSPVLLKRDFLHMPSMWPMDRPAPYNISQLPNAKFKEFNIYHIGESDVDATA